MLDEKKFVSKADAEIKKYGILKDAFQQIAQVEGNLYEKRKKAFDQIKGIKELDNVYISDIYLNLGLFIEDKIEHVISVLCPSIMIYSKLLYCCDKTESIVY